MTSSSQNTPSQPKSIEIPTVILETANLPLQIPSKHKKKITPDDAHVALKINNT